MARTPIHPGEFSLTSWRRLGSRQKTGRCDFKCTPNASISFWRGNGALLPILLSASASILECPPPFLDEPSKRL